MNWTWADGENSSALAPQPHFVHSRQCQPVQGQDQTMTMSHAFHPPAKLERKCPDTHSEWDLLQHSLFIPDGVPATPQRMVAGQRQLKFKCRRCEFSSPSWEVVFAHRCTVMHGHTCNGEPASTAEIVCEVQNVTNVTTAKSAKKEKKKKFFCQQCDFGTSQKQSLSQHVVAVHDKSRPFQCPRKPCTYSCARKQNLDKHVSGVHDKIRPFKCTDCDSYFSQRVTLCNHIKGVHEKKKPFLCPYCEYSCAYKENLNTHIATVHEHRKPHKCDRCGYSCTQRSVLKRHVQSVHEKAYTVNANRSPESESDGIQEETNAS